MDDRWRWLWSTTICNWEWLLFWVKGEHLRVMGFLISTTERINHVHFTTRFKKLVIWGHSKCTLGRKLLVWMDYWIGFFFFFFGSAIACLFCELLNWAFLDLYRWCNLPFWVLILSVISYGFSRIIELKFMRLRIKWKSTFGFEGCYQATWSDVNEWDFKIAYEMN